MVVFARTRILRELCVRKLLGGFISDFWPSCVTPMPVALPDMLHYTFDGATLKRESSSLSAPETLVLPTGDS